MIKRSATCWILLAAPAEDKVAQLVKELNVSKVIAHLLVQRGIDTFDKSRLFFNPSADQLYKPDQMEGLLDAVSFIEEAMALGKKIRFYGDYDVDGTCSVAMMVNHFRNVFQYKNIDFYIPDRYDEGYGISEKGVRDAVNSGVGLMITLDCGIKAHSMLDLAASLGLPVIVCDHHEPDAFLPNAISILNPKRNDCKYPFRELCGCGVGFKLIMGLNAALGYSDKGLSEALQLAAIATCSDIVPIVDENRVIVSLGLAQMNQSPLPGILRLMEKSGKTDYFDVEDTVFMIGPRINAAGRIGHGRGAVALLTADADNTNLNDMVAGIDLQNIERKSLDKTITSEALVQLPEEGLTQVVHHSNWHKGVVGIVASRLIEYSYRPTVVLTTSNGKLTGSARSIAGFDLYKAISECSDLLESFGGHTHAAGLTMQAENLEAFKTRFEIAAAKQITMADLVMKIDVDALVKPEVFSEKFMQVLMRMAPFGPGFQLPVFGVKGLGVLPHTVKVLKGDVLTFEAFDPNNSGKYYDCIGFKMGHKEEIVRSGYSIDLLFQVKWKNWNGTRRMQWSIKDVDYAS